MKIVNFKKFIKGISIVLMAIFIISLICAKSSLSHRETEYTSIYISDGDTLWNIAEELQTSNNYYKNKDIRYIISNVKSINNLKTSNLYIGQEILVPKN